METLHGKALCQLPTTEQSQATSPHCLACASSASLGRGSKIGQVEEKIVNGEGFHSSLLIMTSFSCMPGGQSALVKKLLI